MTVSINIGGGSVEVELYDQTSQGEYLVPSTDDFMKNKVREGVRRIRERARDLDTYIEFDVEVVLDSVARKAASYYEATGRLFVSNNLFMSAHLTIVLTAYSFEALLFVT